DRMYVWGWMPGIYVQAQRLSAAKVASFSDMHVIPPTQLEGYVKWTIEHLKETKPKFIVDSRKRHYPNDRPPLELWPQTKQGFLPVNDAIIKSYDQGYAKLLTERIDADEAARYQAMSVFRQYIRDNYSIVKVQAGNLVLFVRKKDAG
ncbi:MAG: hypothetical protein KAS23_08105, partial [Anaerohalosphaera sp.]|nr:hypothetical protein [Anaerohalosphaera sp.]